MKNVQALKKEYNHNLNRYYNGCNYLSEHPEDFDKYISELIQIKDNVALLNKYLKILNEREKEIVVKRYGLYNTKEMTQKEIAKELKISRSYVSRIEKRALTKMLTEFIRNKNIT